MKLLDKDTIRYQKNAEKKIEIEQGVQLSKSVDFLRQQEAVEKKNLESYREQSLKRVFAEIQDAVTELRFLQDQVKEAKLERERLLEPLKKELAEIENEKSSLSTIKLEFESTKASLRADLESLKKREIHIARKEEEVDELLRKSKDERARSQSSLREIQSILADTHKRKIDHESEYSARMRNLERKEKRANEKELECQSIIKTYGEKVKEMERLQKRYAS